MVVKIGNNEFLLIRKPEISFDSEKGDISIIIKLEDAEEKLYELKIHINYKNKYSKAELLQKNINIRGVYYD